MFLWFANYSLVTATIGNSCEKKLLQIRGLPKALYQISKAIETGEENHLCYRFRFVVLACSGMFEVSAIRLGERAAV
jgi:hypothetical protein